MINKLFKGWLEKRARASSEHYLSQRNIYILPSKQGFAFCLMLALMLLTAINYQSSLIYLLVFILGSTFLISIWLCFFNMQGLVVRVSHIAPVQAGEPVRVELAANLAGKERSGFYVKLDEQADTNYWPMEKAPVIEIRGFEYGRGVFDLPAVSLETFFPFGLIRAWTWMWFDSKLVVYPVPVEPPELSGSGDDEEGGQQKREGEELGDVREYQSGDSMRRVLWRHYARREELVVRSRESVASKKVTLDWVSYSDFGTEQALSYMCFDVLSLFEANQEFALTMPNGGVPLGAGEAHRDQCLTVLARFGG